MRNFPLFILFILLLASCGTGSQSDKTEEENTTQEIEEVTQVSSVNFILPHSGDSVSSPVKITMGVTGMQVEPAGEVHEGMGHHHLIIDGSFIPTGETVPADSTHIHYGKGQTEVEVALSPGPHSITMQFADGVHASYGKEMSTTINVVVVE